MAHEYQQLAHAVILRAMNDVYLPLATKRDTLPPNTVSVQDARRQAARFLATENPDLVFWCNVAGLNVHEFVRKARQRYKRFLAVPTVPTVPEPDGTGTNAAESAV